LDIKEIKQIVDIMKRSSLTEFELEEKDFKIRICRKNGETQTIVSSPTMPPFPVSPQPPAGSAEAAGAEKAEAKEEAGTYIHSPMVGTFYAAPSPDSEPFVKVGDAVDPESVVCIVEAMKVMNEIKAEMSGKIAEILVQNGDSVEYNQPLFRIQ